MYRKIEDFTRDWGYDIDQTTKLFNHLTDASLAQKVTDDGRSLGFLAWHIVLTIGEMTGQVGLKVDAPAEDAPVPATAAEIVAAFEKAGNSLKDAVVSNWTDETLLLENEMYGETWKRGQTLLYLIFHQAHHRGQITVLMRQAGLPVVGIYGPAKEEWAAMGMPAMA
ncbi:MAG: DinB family protein [Acidobacteria bacterium]|nr:DinB family protein [Acidobacteriota bacterium]MBK8813323.1 DinB family protein [Acidobacteriota bacterium]